MLSASCRDELGYFCCSELEAAQTELGEAKAAQHAAEAAARDAERAMGERQKRFQHVHAKLKRDEDALKARVERFEAEAAGYGEQIGAALSQADAAVQVFFWFEAAHLMKFWHSMHAHSDGYSCGHSCRRPPYCSAARVKPEMAAKFREDGSSCPLGAVFPIFGCGQALIMFTLSEHHGHPSSRSAWASRCWTIAVFPDLLLQPENQHKAPYNMLARQTAVFLPSS